MLKFGVIGFGYWGPNIVRNLTSIKETTVHSICDSNLEALRKVQELYPSCHVCSDFNDIITSKEMDVVAIEKMRVVSKAIMTHLAQKGMLKDPFKYNLGLERSEE